MQQNSAFPEPEFPGECPYHRGKSMWDCACGADYSGYDDTCNTCNGAGVAQGLALCATCKGSGVNPMGTWGLNP